MSKSDQTDILVIGGGPAGSLAAYHAARQGCRTILVEEHPEAGVPDHCSGLIGRQGLERLLKPVPSHIIHNYISKAKLVSPEGHIFTITKNKSMFAVNRAKLDQELLQRAIANGTELISKTHIKTLIMKNNGVYGASGQRRDTKETQVIRSKVVIDAEGVRARLLKQAGLVGPAREWILPASQYEFAASVPDPEAVYLCFGKSWAPGFFAWIIPFSDQHVRVGLALKRGYGPPKVYLDHFVRKHPVCSLFKLSSPIRMYGGSIVAAGPIRQTYLNGFLVAGDAAGQTKATSGGGVNIGGYCGKLAGEIAAESIQAQDTSYQFLRKYQVLWKRRFGRELSLMSAFRRRVGGTINDELLEKGFKAAIASNLEKNLEKVKDVDFHALGFFKSVLNPTFVSLGLKNFSSVLKTVLSL